MDARVLREIGAVGLVSGLLLIVVNVLHPIGNTEIYGDAVKFIGKMDTFWVILHLVIAVVLLSVPMVIRGWVDTLSTEHARVWGDFTVTLIVMGTVIGSLALAIAAFLDPRQPRGLAIVAILGAGFAIASVLATSLAGQLTTLSEGGLFRPSTVAFTIVYLWISFRLRRGQTAGVIS